MMGGVRGVANVISRGFEIHPSMIDLYSDGKRFIPQDKLSGHTFMHDFGQGWWEVNHSFALERLNENMIQTVQKYKHLARKTDDILKGDRKAALVYYGASSDAHWIGLLKALFDRYGKKFLSLIFLSLIRLHQRLMGFLQLMLMMRTVRKSVKKMSGKAGMSHGMKPFRH